MTALSLSLLWSFLLFTCAVSENLLRTQFPLYGITEVAAKNNTKNFCNSQLKSLYYAVRKREAWALKIVDASGVPNNGFLAGDNYWLGTYSQCRRISTLHSAEDFRPGAACPPYSVDYFIAEFRREFNGKVSAELRPTESLNIGLCLPSNCSVQDLEYLLKAWSGLRTLSVQSLFNFSMELENVRLLSEGNLWRGNPWLIAFVTVMTFVILFSILGTLYDVYLWKPYVNARKVQKESTEKTNSYRSTNVRNIQESSQLLDQDNNLNNSFEVKIDNSQHKSIPTSETKTETVLERKLPDQPPFLGKLFLCFSLSRNAKAILDTRMKSDDQSVIHGLRFLALAWIILLNSVFYSKEYSGNKNFVSLLGEGFPEQIISNSAFSIDTLFFIGGFLISYIYYRNRRGVPKVHDNFSIKEKVNEFSFMVMKRFSRLTPAYLLVLAIYVAVIRRMKQSSVFQVKEFSIESCEKHWWRNLLYINNLFRSNETCMPWSWYLSTDLQFCMIGTAILICSTRFWRCSASVAGVLMLFSTMVTGYVSYTGGYQPTFDQKFAFTEVLFYPPWTRIGVYLVGMMTGYFVVHLNGKLILKKTTLITGWTVGTLCSMWALFGLYRRNASLISSALYAGLSRSAWGLGLSWIVIASTTGNGGLVNTILSFWGWIPLSRLSYSAYLLNPLVINIIYSSSERALHMDFFLMTVFFVGHLGLTYLLAFFFSLFFETPIARIAKWGIGQSRSPNSLSYESSGKAACYS